MRDRPRGSVAVPPPRRPDDARVSAYAARTGAASRTTARAAQPAPTVTRRSTPRRSPSRRERDRPVEQRAASPAASPDSRADPADRARPRTATFAHAAAPRQDVRPPVRRAPGSARGCRARAGRPSSRGCGSRRRGSAGFAERGRVERPRHARRLPERRDRHVDKRRLPRGEGRRGEGRYNAEEWDKGVTAHGPIMPRRRRAPAPAGVPGGASTAPG